MTDRRSRWRLQRAAFCAMPASLWLFACTADVRLGDLAEPAIGSSDAMSEAANDKKDADGASSSDAPSSSSDAANATDATTDGADAACAIDCHGNPCVANVCQPRILAQNRKTPLYLAADATDVFFTETGHAGTLGDPNPVSKVSKGGGAIVTLAQDDGFPRGIAVDATNVYWNDAAEGGAENVWRASKVDGSSAAIAGRMPMPSDIQGIALSQDTIFAASGPEVRYFGKTASMSFGGEVTNALNHVFGIAVTTDNALLFAADFGGHALGITNLIAATTTPVVVGKFPVDVAIDADYAFVAAGGQLVRVARADQTMFVLAGAITGAVGVAVDTDTVYFTTLTDVRKVPKVGGASTVLATGLSSGGRIVTDATFAFYSDPVLGIIARVPK